MSLIVVQLREAMLAYAPLEHGVLTGKYQPGRLPPAGSRADGPDVWMFDQHFTPDVLRAVQEFRILATEYGFTPHNLPWRGALRHDVVSSVIGAENILHPVQLA